MSRIRSRVRRRRRRIPVEHEHRQRREEQQPAQGAESTQALAEQEPGERRRHERLEERRDRGRRGGDAAEPRGPDKPSRYFSITEEARLPVTRSHLGRRGDVLERSGLWSELSSPYALPLPELRAGQILTTSHPGRSGRT